MLKLCSPQTPSRFSAAPSTTTTASTTWTDPSRIPTKQARSTTCSIDTVQWHLEDIIRNPEIDPAEALLIKRRIDRSNQERTDMVEYIDSYLLDKYKDIVPAPDARLNTETPAWAVDRLSILALKIYHMEQETRRTDVADAHRDACRRKLDVLLAQRTDLSQAIEELLADIEAGRKYMKTYKQMKMYNDPALNPVLYGKK